jgi:tetratricopeptide (TPR) repeat protein
MRVAVAAFLVALIGTLGFLIWRSGGLDTPSEINMSVEPPPTDGPAAIEVGETSRQALPGPDGEPEIWTLHKREADREELAAELLPRPAPRESEPDQFTDSARALDGQALEAWKRGRIDDALSNFEAAIAADPDDWLPRSNYGRLLVMMTNYKTAGPHLERAAELNPDSTRVWLDLYSYYERSLQLERGFHALEKARTLAAGAAIVKDETGLWRLESDSIYP